MSGMVRIKVQTTNECGATFWGLELDNACDGKGKGGVMLSVSIHAQHEGMFIAGKLIPWKDINEAQKYAESHRAEFQTNMEKELSFSKRVVNFFHLPFPKMKM